MSNDLLSVVIVTFENENEIEDCLTALQADCQRSGLECRIIVIDNASKDSTCARVEAWYRLFGIQNQLIRNSQNLGFTVALNQGLRDCGGDYVLILNPDTVVQEDCVENLVNLLKNGQDVGIAAPQLRNPDGSLQPSCRRFPERRDVIFECLGLSRLFSRSRLLNGWKMGDFDHRSRRSVEQPQGACLLTLPGVLRKVGLWDEAYPMFFSDVDWCHRVKNAGFDIIFEPEAKVIHRKGVSIYKRRAAMIWSSHISFHHYLMTYRTGRLSFLLNGIFVVFLVVLAIVRIGASRVLMSNPTQNEIR